MTATAAEASANAEAPATAVPRKRTLWIIGSTAASFAAADPIVEQIRLRYSRLHLIFTPRDPSLSAWLRERHPDSLVNDHPSAFAGLNLRAVRRHNPRLMLLLDGVTRFETALLRAARRRQIPIALLATGPTAGSDSSPEWLDLVERYVALDTHNLATLAARAVARAHHRCNRRRRDGHGGRDTQHLVASQSKGRARNKSAAVGGMPT